VRGLPTAALWADALEGGPFGVVSPEPVQVPDLKGFTGFADAPTGLTLRFVVGESPSLIEVETERRGRFRHEWRLVPMLLERMPTFRYPIVVEEARLRIKIGGRQRVFAGCSLGESFGGQADIGEVSVIIRCPLAVVPALRLERLEGQPFVEFIQVEQKRRNDRLAASRQQ
jgi:hypothetical protein